MHTRQEQVPPPGGIPGCQHQDCHDGPQVHPAAAATRARRGTLQSRAELQAGRAPAAGVEGAGVWDAVEVSPRRAVCCPAYAV